MVPDSLRSLFWDTSLNDLDPVAYPRYTIRRVLEHGDEEQVRWLVRTLSPKAIRDCLRSDDQLSGRSAAFWALVFSLPAGDVAALQRPRTPVIPDVAP